MRPFIRRTLSSSLVGLAMACGLGAQQAVVAPAKPSPSGTFLVLSDVHLHGSLDQDNIGLNTADSGADLWLTALTKLDDMLTSSAGPRPDFVVLLGDLPWHAYVGSSTQLGSARTNTGNVLKALRQKADAAGIPLLYTTGNNDSWSGDYRAFTAPNKRTPFDQDVGHSGDWPVIEGGDCNTTPAPKACIANDKRMELGCYSVYPLGANTKLRVVLLNTVMFNKDTDNSHSTYYYGEDQFGAGHLQHEDTEHQMEWFEGELKDAKSKGESVLIGMHIPPGRDGYQRGSAPSYFWDSQLDYNGVQVQNAFLDLVETYEPQIIGVLSSHTHMDGVRKLYGSQGFTDLVISVAGITPGHGNNPAMKTITYDTTGSFELLDFETSYMPYWNNHHTVQASWGSDSFRFSTVYSCPPGTTMKDWIGAMDNASLLKHTTHIYKAYGNTASSADVQRTLEVRAR